MIDDDAIDDWRTRCTRAERRGEIEDREIALFCHEEVACLSTLAITRRLFAYTLRHICSVAREARRNVGLSKGNV